MTPKEKARDLYNGYWYCLLESNIGNRDYFTKMCSIIAVDELIEQCHSYREIDLGMSLEYWEEVKQEIESYEAVL